MDTFGDSTIAPSPQDVREILTAQVDYWKPRNDLFSTLSEHVEGRNKVSGPAAPGYAVHVTHSGLLAAAVNEKVARFLSIPKIAVVPNNFGTPAREASTELENALEALQYHAERQGDGDVWGRMLRDAVIYNMGVERIEWVPASIWPDLMLDPELFQEKGEKVEKLLKKSGLFDPDPKKSKKAYDKLREDYKKTQGVPIRHVYVPPSCFLPEYDGSVLMRSEELELRSLKSVLDNPMFADAKSELLSFAGPMSLTQQIKQQVVIVHVVNRQIHAYYALTPAQNATSRSAGGVWPNAKDASQLSIGQPIKLYEYTHGLGMSPYNVMGGRTGGWKTSQNEIEAIMKLLCEKSQDADEALSQVKTYLRAVGWPTFVTKYDPDLRDQTGSLPDPIQQKEGVPIALWKTESLETPFEIKPNPILQWYYETIVTEIEKLTGSAAIYGQHQPGVNTGYHANLQITQSEHLDETLEQHFVTAAIQRGRIYLRYVSVNDETVWVQHKLTNEMGRQAGVMVAIEPKKIDPLPMLDAEVRKPRPVDFSVSVRAALDATADRHGPGTPLLDDDTARESILGQDAPDIIQKKIEIQNERKKLLDSGFLSQEIQSQLKMELAKDSQGISADQAANADPALLQSLQGINTGGQAAGMGGVDPQQLSQIMQGGQQAGVSQFGAPEPPPPDASNTYSANTGHGGGLPSGAPQPESAIGRAIQIGLTRGG